MHEFITKFKFNPNNLNEVNVNGVTPLTAAIDHDLEEITLELLAMNVNPLIENIHGNTPLKLSLFKPWFYNIINKTIELYICEFLNCSVNNTITYVNGDYIITKIIPGGSCSLITMQIQNRKDAKIYFAKIKTYFGGLELRNYISLGQYVDLLQIEKIIINDSQQGTKIYKKVYCLIQKYIAGKVLSETFNNLMLNEQKILVAKTVINALCNLHQLGYIHNDALPDNCIWDPINQVANFIDYDVMRKVTDFEYKDQEYIIEKKNSDLERLIMGSSSLLPEKNILGLKDYVEDLQEVLIDTTESVPINFKKKIMAKCKFIG